VRIASTRCCASCWRTRRSHPSSADDPDPHVRLPSSDVSPRSFGR
jgi:hypothetical protein